MAKKRKVWTPAARKAFAAKMKRARAAAAGKRARRANPGRKKVHTAKFDRTVKAVKRSLRRRRTRGNAYAIAQARLGKRARRKPPRRAPRKANPAAIVEVKRGNTTFYLSEDNILSTSKAAAKPFRYLPAAKRTAQALAARLPPGFRVYVRT